MTKLSGDTFTPIYDPLLVDIHMREARLLRARFVGAAATTLWRRLKRRLRQAVHAGCGAALRTAKQLSHMYTQAPSAGLDKRSYS